MLSARSNWEEKARSAHRIYRDIFSPEGVRNDILRMVRGSAQLPVDREWLVPFQNLIHVVG